MKLNINKLNSAFDEAPYGDQENKRIIERMGKAALRKVAAALGLCKSEYRLDYNPGGIAVPGEVTLHTEFVYVQIHAKFFGKGAQVMYRACSGTKDYSGKANLFTGIDALLDPKSFADCLTATALREGTLA